MQVVLFVAVPPREGHHVRVAGYGIHTLARPRRLLLALIPGSKEEARVEVQASRPTSEGTPRAGGWGGEGKD